MRIGVLAGGPSNEREISLKSGRAVHNALAAEGLDVIFLDVKNDICDIINRNKIDVAFIALHGRFGEDGTVQALLEKMRIPYTGSGPQASRLALDKIASKEIFIRRRIPVPKYVIFEKDNYKIEDAGPLGFPVVVKPQWEGSSIGLSVAGTKAQLKDAARKAFQYGPRILIEEYIAGRELTVGILNDAALPVIEIAPKAGLYDYTAKYQDPETKYLVPAPIDKKFFKEAQELGSLSHAALNCRSMSRVDMMMDSKGKIFVLEVNTIPGMTERSLLPKAAQACGLTFGRLCVKLIERALKESYETTAEK